MRAASGDANVQGDIARYGLVEWWLSSFTPEERQKIEARYLSGMSALTAGGLGSSQPVTDFLNGLAGWFRGQEHASPLPRGFVTRSTS